MIMKVSSKVFKKTLKRFFRDEDAKEAERRRTFKKAVLLEQDELSLLLQSGDRLLQEEERELLDETRDQLFDFHENDYGENSDRNYDADDDDSTIISLSSKLSMSLSRLESSSSPSTIVASLHDYYDYLEESENDEYVEIYYQDDSNRDDDDDDRGQHVQQGQPSLPPPLQQQQLFIQLAIPELKQSLFLRSLPSQPILPTTGGFVSTTPTTTIRKEKKPIDFQAQTTVIATMKHHPHIDDSDDALMVSPTSVASSNINMMERIRRRQEEHPYDNDHTNNHDDRDNYGQHQRRVLPELLPF